MNPTKRILVIDDEPDAIKFVSAVLSDVQDCDVLEAEDGETGMQLAKQERPDVIILDVMLPDVDGFEVFYELQHDNSTREIPVIMLTGVANKHGIPFSGKDMEGYIGTRPADYIEKPMDPEKLRSSVERILEAVPETGGSKE